jgi:hypothetical protein
VRKRKDNVIKRGRDIGRAFEKIMECTSITK